MEYTNKQGTVESRALKHVTFEGCDFPNDIRRRGVIVDHNAPQKKGTRGAEHCKQQRFPWLNKPTNTNKTRTNFFERKIKIKNKANCQKALLLLLNPPYSLFHAGISHVPPSVVPPQPCHTRVHPHSPGPTTFTFFFLPPTHHRITKIKTKNIQN